MPEVMLKGRSVHLFLLIDCFKHCEILSLCGKRIPCYHDSGFGLLFIVFVKACIFFFSNLVINVYMYV